MKTKKDAIESDIKETLAQKEEQYARQQLRPGRYVICLFEIGIFQL